MKSTKINIAIDGYSSCGKSTLAKEIAKQLDYVFIDTGAMYRAVTLFALENKLINGVLNEIELISRLPQIEITFEFNKERGTSDVLLNGKNVETEIRQMKVSEKVSLVAAVKEVRKKLVELQQKMGNKKGVVMDGRDIGTVVFPFAELKIFMTANKDVRANRRFEELQLKSEKTTLELVKANLEQRDYIDTNRKEDPLRQAEDAKVLDNSELSREEQIVIAMSWVEAAKSNLA
ncbi:MAG: cytidylate kinase [Crocinitomicaceae bacterium]|nr:cytidylate kinase [Crocinitomicaceae bacterium]|tara:strand:+ start:105947 stop:106645 length:699 start_codon:yes stop_codon:yes gene_type:complete